MHCRSASRPGLWRGAAAAFAEEERCDLIVEALEARRREVGPGRKGLMALASAGCETSSSSYTAGPRPQLPGLWAAELASVASTQALQRDGRRERLRGRRQRKERLGTSQEQAGQARRWLRSGEARARMACAGKACQDASTEL